MKIRFGYVSISKTLNVTTSHTISYRNYKKEKYKIKKLEEIINKNLDNLERTLEFNIKNDIHFYRMTSAIMPLATHKKVKYNALKHYKKRLENIGRIIKHNKMRVDIHLDQFCVLNSTKKEVVMSTINIIKFHKNMLKTMKLNTNMIIHIGSKENGKEESIKRFINNFNKLDKETKNMIIIENDDKSYNIKDTLKICKILNIPMVLDYHHYKCNNENENLEDYIEEIFKTWKNKIPKIHISSPKNEKEYRNHNDYINICDFIDFISKTKNIKRDFDIMIEAKEKDKALFKLIEELKQKNYIFLDKTTLEIKKVDKHKNMW